VLKAGGRVELEMRRSKAELQQDASRAVVLGVVAGEESSCTQGGKAMRNSSLGGLAGQSLSPIFWPQKKA